MKETIIQFGEGNFLRGFFDYFLHKMNEKGLYNGKQLLFNQFQWVEFKNSTNKIANITFI